MKSYKETTESVMNRVTEYRQKRKQRLKNTFIIASVSAACIAVVVVGMIILMPKKDDRRLVYSDPINEETPYSVNTTEPADTSKTVQTDEPKQSATPKQTGKPTDKPSSKPTSQPTSKPTNKPTVQPTNKPTSQPTATPTFEPAPGRTYSLGNLEIMGDAYKAYLAANDDTKLDLSFRSGRNPYERSSVINFRHNGMTFKEWQNAIERASEAAEKIFFDIRDNNIQTEYGVDISAYSWTDDSEIKETYGAYYKYLPPEWFEKMDYYFTNTEAYWTAWDDCERLSAEEDAEFIGRYASKVQVVQNNGSGHGRGFSVVCTISKANLEKLAYATEWIFIVYAA